jgi:hypothetical protein
VSDISHPRFLLLPTYNRLSFCPFNLITPIPTPTLFSSNLDIDEFDEPEESDNGIDEFNNIL